MLFVSLAIVATIIFLMVKGFGPLITRITERMLTGHFQSAEALLERDRLPERWSEQISRMASRGSVRQRLVYVVPWQDAARAFLMDNIRKLRKFFTTCPYVADDETREVILNQIDEIIGRWETLDIPAILEYYDLVLD